MIFVTGDCHGDYSRFTAAAFLQQEYMDRQDYVIVCGDFGFWDASAEQEYWLDWLEQRGFTLLWVDGNHENFDMLNAIPSEEWNGGRVQKIRPHVIHLMRGEIFRLEGHTFFTFGGARSHDIRDGILEREDPQLLEKARALEGAGASYRINHLSWWKEEMPTEEEMLAGMKRLEAQDWTCDYIISHCGPTSVQAYFSAGKFKPDQLTDYFEQIKERCSYKQWYFGHYHDEERLDERHELLYYKIQRIL